MHYDFIAIPDADIPRAANPLFQHLLDTYAGETNKVIDVWRGFAEDDLAYRPHPKSTTVADILKHQLLSERRFFGEFVGTPEPPPADVLPKTPSLAASIRRMEELARPRLAFFAAQSTEWWMADVPFFGLTRQRIWVFWRRVLHTCHHRTQLTVYLRLLNKPVMSVYGPTSDQTWEGADPTNSVEAAGRK
ncbi:MAG: DinB family protein [Candidatus Korobacteraceae bacterium]